MVNEVVVVAATHLDSLDVLTGDTPPSPPQATPLVQVGLPKVDATAAPEPTQAALFSPRGADPEEYGRATSQDFDQGSYHGDHVHEDSDIDNCYAGDHPDDESVGYHEG